MQCTHSHWVDKQGIRVPCGVCRSCRIRRATEWTIRITHELANVYNHRGCFITLTYNDKSVPLNYAVPKKDWEEKLPHTLNDKHLTNFFKKLRINLKRNNDETKIKYYACGEYGEPPKILPNGHTSQGFRPHYHAVILGLNYLNPRHRDLVIQSWSHCDWTPERIKNSIGYASVDSIRYTCDYIQKSYLSWDRGSAEKHYAGRQKPFNRMSKGIGESTCYDLEKTIVESGKIPWRGKEVGLPRYYANKIEVPEHVKEKNRAEMLINFREKHGIPWEPNPELNPVNGKVRGEKIEQIDWQVNANLTRKNEISNIRKGKILSQNPNRDRI